MCELYVFDFYIYSYAALIASICINFLNMPLLPLPNHFPVYSNPRRRKKRMLWHLSPSTITHLDVMTPFSRLINDIINPGEPAGIKEAVRLMDSVKKHCRKKNRRRLLMPYMSHPISRIFNVHMVFLQLPYMRLLCFDCQKF